MLKLVFAGTPDVAVPSLKAFATDPRFDVVGVIPPPRCAYRSRPQAHAQPGQGDGSGARAARHRSQTPLPEFMEALNDLHADIAAVIAYGNILPKNVLDAVPMGWYNLHFSDLAEVAWRRSRPACDLGGRPDHRRRRVQGGRGFGRWPDRRFPDHRADRP